MGTCFVLANGISGHVVFFTQKKGFDSKQLKYLEAIFLASGLVAANIEIFLSANKGKRRTRKSHPYLSFFTQ